MTDADIVIAAMKESEEEKRAKTAMKREIVSTQS
jgi:hypothetical protein